MNVRARMRRSLAIACNWLQFAALGAPLADYNPKMTSIPAKALAALLLAGLAGCGSGDYQPAVTPPPVTPDPPVTPPVVEPPVTPPVTPPVVEPPVTPPVTPTLPAVVLVWNHCEKPRGPGYPDVQGTLDDERTFLRLFTEETYLWYKEVPTDLVPANYSNPVDYFNVLKTPLLTPSGRPKDRFHFSYPTDKWEEMAKGANLGYGVHWAQNGAVPRIWRLSTVEPGSAADKAGLRRGDQLLTVDGEDFVNGTGADLVARFNAALFPLKAGEQHKLTVQRGTQVVEASMTSASVTSVPVRGVQVLDTPTGKVGYLAFSDHIGASENMLVKAITQLKAAGVADLVLDMRYNGGGQLNIASELAYMIAGPAQTAGQTFELTTGNDKMKPKSPLLFKSTAVGYSAPDPIPAGQALPTLNLKRVSMLTSAGTCSASESLINGLRGVGVEVNLIGEQTCGKPYAFAPQQNCGVTYFTIQYQGVNAKGFGDYADGFAPTCRVPDDFTHELGDRAEGQLAAALQYRSSGSCPAVAQGTRARSAAPAPVLVPVRPMGKEISIIGL
jgi:C-terminal processing protease CtpA/Prc